MCQIAACLVPKFKLNWAMPDDQDNIKHTLVNAVSEHSSITSSQETSSSYTSNPISMQCEHSDSEDEFFSFGENIVSNSNSDVQLLIDNYLSSTSVKSPSGLPIALREAYIQYNTAVPSSAHVERLFSAGGLLFSKRRGSMADKHFEMTLLLKFNKYFE